MLPSESVCPWAVVVRTGQKHRTPDWDKKFFNASSPTFLKVLKDKILRLSLKMAQK